MLFMHFIVFRSNIGSIFRRLRVRTVRVCRKVLLEYEAGMVQEPKRSKSCYISVGTVAN